MSRDTYTVRTNEISVDFHYDALLEDYRFYEIVDRETKDAPNAGYKSFYHRLKQVLKPEARCVLPGSPRRYVVAMKPSDPIPDTMFSFRRIHKEELASLPKGRMLSLLLSVMIKKGLYFEPGSLPYDVYYPHTVQKNKITALKINIAQKASKLYLNLSVTAFVNTDPDKTKKPLFVYDQGVLIDYDPARHKKRTAFTKGSFGNTKTTIAFMDIGGTKFTKTKVYFLNMIYEDIKTLLAPYLDMTFATKEISVYASTDDALKRRTAIKARIKEYALQHFPLLPVVDLSHTEAYASNLCAQLQKTVGGLIDVPIVDNIPDDVPAAITVTEPEAFYKETKKDDPYVKLKAHTSAVLQNVTTATELSESVSMVFFKELAVKAELCGSAAFITHPKHIEGIRYIAVIDDKEEIFHKAFLENGKMSADVLTAEEQQYCESLLCTVPVGEEPEYIVISPQGTMLVTKTLLYPLPDFEKLNQTYMKAAETVLIKKTDILSILDEERRKELVLQIEQLDTPQGIPSDCIVKILNTTEKNKLKQTIRHPLKFSARDKESKKMYIGMLGTTFACDDDKSILYRSGLSSGSIRATVRTNSPYRRIISVRGKTDLDAVLPLLDEYFVKYGEITVLPYPVKYAREGWKMSAEPKKEEEK